MRWSRRCSTLSEPSPMKISITSSTISCHPSLTSHRGLTCMVKKLRLSWVIRFGRSRWFGYFGCAKSFKIQEDAAEHTLEYLLYGIRKPRNVAPRIFIRQLKQLSSYIPYLPGACYSPQATSQTTPTEKLTDLRSNIHMNVLSSEFYS